MSVTSSSEASTSKQAKECNKYLSKYILCTQNLRDEKNSDLASDGGNKSEDVFQTSENYSQVTVEQVLRKITETAKILETPDVRNKSRKKVFSKGYKKKLNEDFMSFSQLQSQVDEENKESLFNNSFEIEENALNSCKIDSQWNCDTQLETLVDNADAILNMFNNKETTQCFASKSVENPQDHTHMDKMNLDRNLNLNEVSNENADCIPSIENGMCSVFENSVSQPSSTIQKDSNVFKVPLLRSKGSKFKCIDTIPTDRSHIIIGSRSQTVDGSNSNIEPLLFSQSCGFKTASQKNIQISRVALVKAAKIFENIDDIQNGILDNSVYTSDNANSNIKSIDTMNNASDSYDPKSPLDFREAEGDKHMEEELFDDTVVETMDSNCDQTAKVNLSLDCTKNTSNASSNNERNAFDSCNEDNKANLLLNETYVVKDTTESQTKVVELQHWETFFNNTMTSPDASNRQQDDSDDSDDNLPASPILVSQKVKDRIICRKSVSESDQYNMFGESRSKIHTGVLSSTDEPLNTSNDACNVEKESNFSERNEEINSCVGFKTANNEVVTDEFNDIVVKVDYHNREFQVIDNMENDRNESPEKLDYLCTSEPNSKDENKKRDMGINDSFGGFKTASNKEITISEMALSKVKTIFANIDEDVVFREIDKKETKSDVEIEKESSNVQISSEFVTASNKQIEITENSFEKAKSFFDDIDMETEMGKIDYDDNHLDKIDSTFLPAGGKNVDESEATLVEVKSLFKDMENKENDINITSSLQGQGFSGSTTANSEQVSIAIDAPNKVKSIFNNISTDNKDICRENCDDVSKIASKSSRADSCPQFGFTTASNKEIHISEQALKKAKSLFDDIDLEGEFKSDIVIDNVEADIPRSSGFRTASNKNITISEEAVLKAKSLFDGIESEFDNELSDDELSHNIQKDSAATGSSNFPGFSTASNKTITVSEEALLKAKTLFNDIDSQTKQDNNETLFNDIDSQTKQDNNETLFKDIDSQTKQDNNDYISPGKIFEVPTPSSNPPFLGFSTASNKTINVSEKSLLEAKLLFEDIDEKIHVVEDSVFKKPTSIPNQNFPGFTTANNKNIKISDAALLKAKTLFSDIDIQSEQDTENDDFIPNTDINVAANKFPGFTTGNNKKIVVPDVALSKAKNIFCDMDLECAVSTPAIKDAKAFNGFMTASNKDITVSEGALLKAKLMFKDLDPNDNDNENVSPDPESVNDVHFGDPKEVVENLNKDSFKDSSNVESTTKFIGFNTASNKSIPISEKGLAEARRIFDNIDKEYGNNDVLVDVTETNSVNREGNGGLKPFVGFSTANNDKITVSKEALKKVHKLFTDLDCDDLRTNADKKVISIRSENLRENAVNLISRPSSKDNECIGDLPEKSKTSFPHVSLTQEISESTKALLNDENALTDEKESVIVDIEAPSSPILPSRMKKNKKAFKTPYKEGDSKINGVETKVAKKRKIDYIENDIVPEIVKIKSNISFEKVDLGNLFSEKTKRNTIDKVSLKHFKPCHNEIDADVLDITPGNFEQFVFKDERVDVKIENVNKAVTVKDLAQMFMNNSSLNQKLIPENWVVNHTKWIIWKLASYERFFGDCFSGVLTVGNVLKQLKLRYDRELYKAERPLLRKILECDDVPGRKMVLCVSRIIKPPDEEGKGDPPSNVGSYELELTDGWYSVLATIDSLLVSGVRRGKLTVGTKLITCGAELHNCGQGKSPLEDVSEVRLRLHGNSTRVAPWHTKLGVCRYAGLLRIGADSLRARAGPVPVLCLLPLVVYPQLFVEKLPSGDTVTRSERLEQAYLSSMEGEIQTRVEELYIEAERELLEEKKRKSSRGRHTKGGWNNGKVLDDEEMLDLMEEASDPGEIMASLSSTQHERIMNCAARKQAETRDKIDARVKDMMKERGVGDVNRKVISILKVRGLILELNRGVRKVTPVMLTVWKVHESTLDLLNRMQLLNLYWATPTGIRTGELHLSTSKQTTFTEIKNKKYIDSYPEAQKYIRRCTTISDMNHPSFKPIFNEVDTVGLVFKIEPSTMTLSNHSASKNNLQMSPNMQTVYVADESMNIIAVHFWGGIVKFGYEKTVETGKILACRNLQHRPRASRKRFRNLYATEYSTFSQCPRRKYVQDSYRILENKLKLLNVDNFMEDCKRNLIELSNNSSVNSFSSVNNSSNNNNSYSSVKNNSDFNSRLKRKLELNENSISGLDFDSSFGEPSSSHRHDDVTPYLGRVADDRETVSTLDITPSDVDQRIKRLKMYDEPPPLSPIVLNVSKTLQREFVTPQKDVHNIDNITTNFGANKLCVSADISMKTPKKISYEGEDVKIVDAECGENGESDPFKENFVYSPPDLE